MFHPLSKGGAEGPEGASCTHELTIKLFYVWKKYGCFSFHILLLHPCILKNHAIVFAFFILLRSIRNLCCRLLWARRLDYCCTVVCSCARGMTRESHGGKQPLLEQVSKLNRTFTQCPRLKDYDDAQQLTLKFLHVITVQKHNFTQSSPSRCWDLSKRLDIFHVFIILSLLALQCNTLAVLRINFFIDACPWLFVSKENLNYYDIKKRKQRAEPSLNGCLSGCDLPLQYVFVSPLPTAC